MGELNEKYVRQIVSLCREAIDDGKLGDFLAAAIESVACVSGFVIKQTNGVENFTDEATKIVKSASRF